MSTRSELVATAQETLAAADVVIAAVAAGTYTTVRDYEAAANAVRTLLALDIPAISAEWGPDGAAAVRALRTLAVRLLDLRTAVSDATATVERTVARTTSLLELAVEEYGELDRWEGLVLLNPDLPHPGFLRPGDVVVLYVR